MNAGDVLEPKTFTVTGKATLVHASGAGAEQ